MKNKLSIKKNKLLQTLKDNSEIIEEILNSNIKQVSLIELHSGPLSYPQILEEI